MVKINMKKFSDKVADNYAKRRIKEERYKKDEWKIVRKYIRKNHKILDLCCGPGTFLVPLTKEGYKIEGIDFSKGMLKEAKKFARKENVKIRITQG
ncbi:MAG: class I SAM-dependent methyltransferase, partial [Candidatus Aenigmarchaeota archaeon]|nr:class I SAM-dependent methyltransferase [Candidatus Aenigmarchaeota archaeon]